MNVLFIGATGLVGSHVVPFLKEQFALTLAAYNEGEVAGLPVTAVDICDWDATAALIAKGTPTGESFDAVVYCATAEFRNVNHRDVEGRRKYFEHCIEVNARGAYHVFEAAYRAGVPRVVHTGSLTAMLGQPRYDYIDADTPDRPHDLYAATKIFGENVGRTYAFRPRWHKSDPADYNSWMRVICLRLGHPFESEELWKKSRYQDSRVGVVMEDIARAMQCALLTDERYGVYSIVSETENPYVDPSLYAGLGYQPIWKISLSENRWNRLSNAEGVDQNE